MINPRKKEVRRREAKKDNNHKLDLMDKNASNNDFLVIIF
jgi:hypothetical protein